MAIWLEWWKWASELRGACKRERTFMWLLAALAGFCIRRDLLGVSSFVRCLGLRGCCYDRLLDFFHSRSLDADALASVWTSALLRLHPGTLRHGGLPVLVCDGIKVGKSGRRMPGVKLLHQESDSNTKPEYIMGHSCQSVCLLAGRLGSFAAIPLAARIHEGLVFSNRDKRTLLDKMVAMVMGLKIEGGFILLADAFFASRKVILPLLKNGCHLISRVKSNAVAYRPAVADPSAKPGRGRRKVYGEKVRLSGIFDSPEAMTEAPSPVYGEKGVSIRVRSLSLLWRPVGVPVLFVAVSHPTRGNCILVATDTGMDPLEVVRLYGLRFKIEVSFKQSLHTVGAYLHHFWMAAMTPLRRGGGDQHLHLKTEEYRNAVRRKTEAYHRFMQVGLVAQGIMSAIATTEPGKVWRAFGSWLRTVRPGVCPSEMVVATALRNSFPEFITSGGAPRKLAQFILARIDTSRNNTSNLAA